MRLRYLTTSALALILMAGCEDTGTGVAPDDIAGTWTATAIVFTSVADPNVSVDLVVTEQAAATFVLNADATYTLTFSSALEPTENEAGVYTVTGTDLNLSPTGTGSPETFTISRIGDNMTLTGSAEFEFDPLVGEEAATMVITLRR
jgi:hypothetical protein